jgi:hypothetical protein
MRSLRHVALAASILGAGTLGAQTSESATQMQMHITPYVGYMMFGDYLKGPFGTSLTNSPGLVYGTQLSLPMSKNLSLVGNLGYTSSDFQIGVPFFGGFTAGHSTMYLYDAGLEYNFGVTKTGTMAFTPFVTGGVGAMTYNINADELLSTQATNLAGNIGVGADFVVGRGVALRLMAKDYIGQFNFQDATGLGLTGQTAQNFALTAGLKFDF